MLQLFNDVFQYILGLDETQIRALVVITALLILFMVYHWLGFGGLLGLLAIYFFAYILYTGHIVDKYNKNEADEAHHMDIIQQELNKDDLINK